MNEMRFHNAAYHIVWLVASLLLMTGCAASRTSAISDDGAFIAFRSSAGNLSRSAPRSALNVYVFPNPLP